MDLTQGRCLIIGFTMLGLHEEQLRTAGVKKVGHVHLGNLVSGLRQSEEKPSCCVWLCLLLIVCLLEFLRNPRAALADPLEQVHGNLAVPHCAHAI